MQRFPEKLRLIEKCGILFTLLLSVCILIGIHFNLLDGLHGRIFSKLYTPDTTVYAPGYSDEAFRSIKVGMTVEEVTEKLGVPLKKWEGIEKGSYYMRWSWSPPSGNYRVRTIEFLADRVIEIHTEYYLD